MLTRFALVKRQSNPGWYVLRYLSSQALTDPKPSETTLKSTKKPQRPPFMKNVFRGLFDLEMLTYPELSKEGLEELKKRVEPFKKYFDKHVDPVAISNLKMIPHEVTENLKNMGLFGQNIPESFGGRDQTAVETAYISEIVAKDLDIALTLYSHNLLGVQAIVKYGNLKQKEKYLPRMATGECIASFCMSEITGSSDLAFLQTKVSPSIEDPNASVLNGKKQWVINGTNADVFVVVAVTDHETKIGKVIPVVKMCLVDRDTPGVTISQPCEYLGLNALRVCEVEFKDVLLNSDNFLEAELFKGFDQCIDLINGGRYNVGAITLSVMKNLLNEITEFTINRRQLTKSLADNESIQSKMEEIALFIYTLESMTYHSAMVLDQYESPDLIIEAAIIKVFSFSEGRRCLDLIMDTLGGRAFLTSEKFLKRFNDFRTMEVFDGTVDLAKLFISLLGIQHTGASIHEMVLKSRFPFKFPIEVFKNALSYRRHANNDPKLTLKLYEQLHPSLTEAANGLERCVLMMDYALVKLLSAYGTEIVNQQNELNQLADSAVKIYAMTCVLARASRSYCIGLPEAESELKYAIKICRRYEAIVVHTLDTVTNIMNVEGEVYSFKLGKHVVSHKSYFVKHPLERSY